jgi:hypothetical protein
MKHTLQSLLAALLFLVLGNVSFVQAHAINLWCYVENDRVYVEGFFMGGQKTKHTQVFVVNEQGEKILTGTTDAEGKFDFEPPYQGNMTVFLHVDESHQVDFELTEEDFLEAAAEAAAAANK